MNWRARLPRISRLGLQLFRLALPVLLAVAVVASLVLVAMRSAELREERARWANDLAQRSANLAGHSIWNLNEAEIDAQMAVLTADPVVRCVQLTRVQFFEGMAFGERCAELEGAKHFAAPITWRGPYDAHELGTLELWVDSGVGAATAWTTLWPLLTLLAVLLLALILILMFAFRRAVLMPLERVGDSLRRYRESGERARVDWRSSDELGEFIAEYNAVLGTQERAELELQRAVAQSGQALAELQQAQLSLVQSEKMAALGTLTAGVAHEINNPTNFADGAVQHLLTRLLQLQEFLHQLAGGDADPSVLAAIDARIHEIIEMAGTAREGHERIKRIVADLRQITRLDEAEHKPMRLSEPIRSTVNLVRTRYDRMTFDLDLGFDPEVECQPAKLAQVFMNLIVNACEAVSDTGRKSWVRIATAQTDTDVVVHVEDNGPGMDEATLSRVFEPFFTTKPVGKGTGLGLSVSAGIIREHGGDIAVQSVLGAGTHFILRLPLASGHRPEATLAPGTAGGAPVRTVE